jgi:Type VI secretion system (T6SS), amidase effector protein 4
MPNRATVVRTNSIPGSIKEVQLKALTFDELWNNYVTGNPYRDPNGQYGNQCAIRMSATFHRLGIGMKSHSKKFVAPMPGKPTLGRIIFDGNPTATRAYESAEWLKLRPLAGLTASQDITGSEWRDKVTGRTGIIFFFGYWQQEWLLGPPVIYGCVGYVGLVRKWSTVQWITTGLILLLGTVAFYPSWYAYRAFI